MAMTSKEHEPDGFVGLADAIESLRNELYTAMLTSSHRDMRFRVPTIELNLEVAVTNKAGLGGGIKWWVVEANAEYSRESITTQSLKLELEPIFVDADGNEIDALIEGERNPGRTDQPFHDMAEGGHR